jgi:V/A-type H+-transporting ATPase subunit D
MVIKYTKTELRNQQVKLAQLQKYLPTLQLKKALLQIEVASAALEIANITVFLKNEEKQVERFQLLLSERYGPTAVASASVESVISQTENIAGVEIPIFEKVLFHEPYYSLFDTPPWLDSAVEGLRGFVVIREKLNIAKMRKKALEKELREVSIRVNLFEKIMIPRSLQNIKKIKIFLGDQQLAAVAQAKVAKKKILLRKRKEGRS